MNDIEKRIDKMLKKSEVILNAGKQTNEEWLRTCSTEELAEFIRKQRDDWSDGWYSDWHKTEEIIEWLKQPRQKE